MRTSSQLTTPPNGFRLAPIGRSILVFDTDSLAVKGAVTRLGAREGGKGDGDRDERSLSSSSLRALVFVEEPATAELRSTRTGDGKCARRE
jgi:hypothetical protein